MSELVKHTTRLWERRTAEGAHFLFWCPACGHGHGLPTPRWSFNGDVKSPTFTPSLRVFVTDPQTKKQSTLCHLTITAGRIHYHADCPHELKGQAIDMQDLPPDYGF